jgi:glycerate kinase
LRSVVVAPDKFKGSLRSLKRVELTGLSPRLREVEFMVACDVDHPLLGKCGAGSHFRAAEGRERRRCGGSGGRTARRRRVSRLAPAGPEFPSSRRSDAAS